MIAKWWYFGRRTRLRFRDAALACGYGTTAS
jgi:hypothetical protein